ncbi:colicin uptake protein TolQ [Gemmata sp. SH-PL17]|uniref:MotA/TolQ/ExbB proton channel family protein n=1 Tax=Gemmata sp. SH-PL17 TaxID=1630693 RepID=UPI0004B8FB67|nr:MotA/TolQ/ExbB proton channel family protein [Gemmata sp. SH-PL17]AMV26812.1 colicin uptake protein TolQ [Gemmata sp. SH-PL17]
MNAVYDFFIKEWYFSIPLVIMSLIAAALVIWRLLLNNTANTDMDDFLPLFQQTLRKGGVKAAVSLCREEKGLIPSRLFIAGLEAADQGAAAMRRSMANENELEIVPRLHFLLAPILAIAKIATMVGLFFTVISMINTFNAIGEGASSGKAKEIGGHASKIGLALFATALGLFTAIPLVFSHVLFKDWIAKFEIRVKASSQKLITLVTNYKKDPKLLDQPEKEDAEDEDENDRARRKRKARAD